MSHIYLVPIVFHDKAILKYLKIEIKKELSIPIEILDMPLNPQFAFNPSRDQYNSTMILAKLLELAPDQNSKIVGITSLDLHIPVLTYVFGEAQLNGKAAVVSSYRLQNELYGLSHDEKLFRNRLLTEIHHELGHTFGLIHCANQDCALHPSTYVEEIDLKTSHYCSFCKSMIQLNLE